MAKFLGSFHNRADFISAVETRALESGCSGYLMSVIGANTYGDLVSGADIGTSAADSVLESLDAYAIISDIYTNKNIIL